MKHLLFSLGAALLCLAAGGGAQAQEQEQEQSSANPLHIKGRWSAKVGYARWETGILSSSGQMKYTGSYSLEAFYGVLGYAEAGLYLRMARYTTPVWTGSLGPTTSQTKWEQGVGLAVNLHLVPVLLGGSCQQSPLDVYLLGRLGRLHYTRLGMDRYITEYSGGLGLTYYPLKHWGVFAECTYYTTHKAYSGYTHFRGGIAVKF